MPGESLQLLYDVRSIGAAETLKQLKDISDAFVQIKKNKLALNGLKATTDDPEELRKINDKLAEQTLREAELAVELKEKQILLTQIAIERASQLAQDRANAAGIKAVTGSYNDLNKQYRDLLAQTKNGIPLSDIKGLDTAKANLKALRTELDNFNRSISSQGNLIGEYSNGIVQAFQRLGLGDVIRSQLNNATIAVRGLDSEFDKLRAEFISAKQVGAANLGALEQQLIENRQEAQKLTQQVEQVQLALNGTGQIGAQITSALKQNFASLKQDVAGFFIGYIGFQATIQELRSSVRNNSSIADQKTDLQRILETTKEQVDAIDQQIRGLETRTSYGKLLDFSIIAAKAGTAKEEIAGVTKSIDELQLVAGKELGDNVDKTVTSVVKLINIFDGPNKVTGENIERYGNALVTLANKGVATGEFIVDYSQRLAGIEGLTKIQIQSVLGLAAAFEEQGVSAQVAATASSQMIIKISADLPKYAGIAGETVAAFKELIRTNPAEALLKVAEGVKGNAQFFDQFASELKDVGAEGARVATAMGVMGDKGDFFRQKIQIATEALQDNTAITEAAAQKQENFAASTDKLRKTWELFTTSQGAQVTLTLIIGFITFLIGHIPLVLSLMAAWGVSWVALNTQTAIGYARLLAYNVAIGAYNIALGIATAAQTAYAAGMAIVTGATNLATGAMMAFRTALLITPLGAIAALLGLLVGAVVGVTVALRDGSKAAIDYANKQQVLAKVTSDTNLALAAQLAKMAPLVQVYLKSGQAIDVKKKALKELIALNPDYLGGLAKENLTYEEGRKILLNYIDALKQKSAYEAASSILTEKTKKDIELLELQYDLEKKIAEGRTDVSDLTDAEKAIAPRGRRTAPFASSVIDVFSGGSAAEDALNNVKEARAALAKELDVTKQVVEDKFTEMAAKPNLALPLVLTNVGRTITAIRDDIAKTTQVRDAAVVGTKEFIDARKKLEELQKELDDAEGKKNRTGASRLSAGQKDAFKDIEAEQKAKLTALNTAYQEQDEARKTYNNTFIGDERTYLEQLQVINDEAINKKLSKLKGANAAERQTIAELRLQLIEEHKKTNDQLYNIDLDDLKAEKERLENQAQEKYNDVVNDPNANDVQKAAALVNLTTELLNIQRAFIQSMEALDKEYNKQLKKAAEDRAGVALELKRKNDAAILNQTKVSNENELQELKDQYEARQRVIDDEYYGKVYAALIKYVNNVKLKEEELKNLRLKYVEDTLNAQLHELDTEAELLRTQYANNLKTKKEYLDQMAALDKRYYDLQMALDANADAQKEKARKLQEQGLNTSFNVYQTFTQGYITLLQQQIDKDLQATNTQIDNSEQVALANATSEKEKADIQAEFDNKRAEADKEAARQRKELVIKQIALEFVLASMKALSTSTTIYDGLAQEAFVAIEYAAKLAVAEAQEFEEGGMPDSSGVIGGNLHANGGNPFMWKGKRYNAERDEIMMIMNRKSATSGVNYTVSGTPAQITSALNSATGGKNFAPGGRIQQFEYGGALGLSLPTPVYSQSHGNNTSFDDIKAIVASQHAQISTLHNTILNLKVSMSPKEAANALNNHSKKVDLSNI